MRAFHFDLPDELIAAYPAELRDESRLLKLDRASASWSHGQFRDIAQYLRSGDLLVVNNTRVIEARLQGRKRSGGRVELLLVRPVSNGCWLAMAKGKSLSDGCEILVSSYCLRLVERRAEGWLVESDTDWYQVVRDAGTMPLPPYILQRRRALQRPETWEHDASRYQTVFASQPGAVAAPTAGLHFTPDLLAVLRQAGVRMVEVTLHVGPGTFQPLRVEQLARGILHEEWYAISPEAAAMIRDTKASGQRVVAIGTTVVRALESAARASGEVAAGNGTTRLLIQPGFVFRVVDALVTNFHLPDSSLLWLVAAFAGPDLVHRAYADAVRQRYRFYSYGDAMLIT